MILHIKINHRHLYKKTVPFFCNFLRVLQTQKRSHKFALLCVSASSSDSKSSLPSNSESFSTPSPEISFEFPTREAALALTRSVRGLLPIEEISDLSGCDLLKSVNPDAKFRFAGKMYSMTYARCGLSIMEAGTQLAQIIRKTKDRSIVYMEISQEEHKEGLKYEDDSKYHLHVFIDLNRRIESTKSSFFDLKYKNQNYHPHIKAERNPKRALAYLRKDLNFGIHGTPPPYAQNLPSKNETRNVKKVKGIPTYISQAKIIKYLPKNRSLLRTGKEGCDWPKPDENPDAIPNYFPEGEKEQLIRVVEQVVAKFHTSANTDSEKFHIIVSGLAKVSKKTRNLFEPEVKGLLDTLAETKGLENNQTETVDMEFATEDDETVQEKVNIASFPLLTRSGVFLLKRKLFFQRRTVKLRFKFGFFFSAIKLCASLIAEKKKRKDNFSSFLLRKLSKRREKSFINSGLLPLKTLVPTWVLKQLKLKNSFRLKRPVLNMYSKKVRSLLKDKSAIYIFINVKRGMAYLGSAANIFQRLGQHLSPSAAVRKRYSNIRLQRSLSYGGREKDFVFAILEWVPRLPSEIGDEGNTAHKKRLLAREQVYLKLIPKEFKYNFNEIAGSSVGCKHSEATKKKMSLALKGRKRSEEVKKLISLALKKRIISLETRKKLSLANTGRKNSALQAAKQRDACLNMDPKVRAKIKASIVAKKGFPLKLTNETGFFFEAPSLRQAVVMLAGYDTKISRKTLQAYTKSNDNKLMKGWLVERMPCQTKTQEFR